MIKNTAISLFRPPVVTILGHVDHGKTTLLDTLRKTNIAGREYGGITQHIGAYQIEVIPKNDFVPVGHKITFIDTPGHAAFSAMRSRGAKVADIAILVIAGNDGIMPQTRESLLFIKEAGIPFIVAVNKIDLPDINLEKIKKQLTKEGVALEEYGGETPLVPISAKSGQGLPKLLEMILLVHELNQPKDKAPSALLQAIVIESKVDKSKGITATVIVRNGTLSIGDEVVNEAKVFKIRALTNWLSKNLQSVGAGDPVEILGFQSLPPVGSILQNKSEEGVYKRELINQKTVRPDESTDNIKIIIKSDSAGTLEAIIHSLKDKVEIILCAVGNITESDVWLAKTTKALIIGFHMILPDKVQKLAQTEKVLIKTYNIIYELFDEIDDVIEALKKGDLVEILGEAQVKALFNYNNETVAGVKVVSGRIARGDQVKIMRGEIELGRARIKSLKHLKEDVTKMEQGKEAGVLLTQKLDILAGDSIIAIG